MRIVGEDLEGLEALGFDLEGFLAVWRDHESGRWARDLVIGESRLSPPSESDLTPLPPRGSEERARLERIGREAIDGGQVGAIVLNGGMATRFGGVVKGTVEVVDGRSFLDLKLSQIRSVSGKVPVFLMNSPATHEATLEHVVRIPAARELTFTFLQPVGPRVDAGGELVRGPDGAVSTAGMGHGDCLRAFRRGIGHICSPERWAGNVSHSCRDRGSFRGPGRSFWSRPAAGKQGYREERNAD